MKGTKHLLPLALMAMFALMIPLYSMTHPTISLRSVSAQRVTIPTNEPRIEFSDPTPTKSPHPTPKTSKPSAGSSYGY